MHRENTKVSSQPSSQREAKQIDLWDMLYSSRCNQRTFLIHWFPFWGQVQDWPPIGCEGLRRINLALSNLAISLPMARLFSSPKRRKGCFTGLHFGSMFKLCSASSLGTPFMSVGCQVNMSLFSRRNSTSALSYLGSRFIPMAVVLEASPTTSSTDLVSMEAFNVGAESEIYFFDAGISEASTLLWISFNSSL